MSTLVVFRCCGASAHDDAPRPPNHATWCRVGPRLSPRGESEPRPRWPGDAPRASWSDDLALPSWAQPGELVPCRCGGPLAVDVTCGYMGELRSRVLVCQRCLHALTQACSKLRRQRRKAGRLHGAVWRPKVHRWFSPTVVEPEKDWLRHNIFEDPVEMAKLRAHAKLLGQRIALDSERRVLELLTGGGEDSRVIVVEGPDAIPRATFYADRAIRRGDLVGLGINASAFKPLVRDVTP